MSTTTAAPPIPALNLPLLSGKSILITGGSSGLGLATSKAFAAAGAYVTIADINPPIEPLEFKNVSYVHCDTTSWTSQTAAFKHGVEFAPRKVLDVVVLYAGTGSDAGNLVDHVLAVPEGSEPHQPGTGAIDVNLTGVFFSAFLALHYFRLNKEAPKGTKSLVFVSSMAGYVDYQPHTAYNAGKFGVRAVWRSVRGRVGDLGVRSNLIAPWYIDTPMTKSIRKYMAEKGIEEGQGVRFGTLDNVVKAAGIFAGDESVDGRAYAIIPEEPGILDMRDDFEGKYAGEELVKFLERSMEHGDIEL